MAVASPLPYVSLLHGLAQSRRGPHGASRHFQCLSSLSLPPFGNRVLPLQLPGLHSSIVASPGLPSRTSLAATCCCSCREGRERSDEENLVTESSEEEVGLNILRRNLLGAAVAVLDVPGLFQTAGTWTGAPAAAMQSPGAKIPMVCPEGSTVKLSIEGNCGLGVSIYPDFEYNPEGGGGSGSAADADGNRIRVNFDATTLNIPSVQFKTTKFLGLPLPPPLRIDIVSDELQGFIDRTTGKVELSFIAQFSFSAGPLYHAPPLLVNTLLTTERTEGTMRSAQGQRMDDYGRCRLVGVARIQPVDDAFMTNFLMLPTDVLAELPVMFEIVPPKA